MTTPGEQIWIEVRSAIFSVAFQRNGNHIVGGSLNKAVRIWRTDGREIGRAIKLGSAIRSVATSEDGRWIVCGGDGGFATICNTLTHDKVIEVKGHTFGVIAVDISPDSRRFATGSYDGTAIIWNIPAAQTLVGPLKHNGPVSGVIFSPDGDRLATAPGSDSSVRIFDSYSGKLLIHLPDAVSSVCSTPIAWSNDGRHVFSAHRGQIKKFDVSAGKMLSTWTAHHEYSFESIALARSNKFIAYSTGKPGLVSLWDVATHARLAVIAYSGDVRSVALSPDGTWLAAGQYDNKITLRNLTSIVPPSFLNIPIPSPSPPNLTYGTGVLSALEEQSGSLEQDLILEPCTSIRVRIPSSSTGTTDRDVTKVQQVIREAVEQTTRDSPRVLIDTTSGVLHDKAKQRRSFEESETCNQLVASMMIRIDQEHVQRTVAEYYKYAMLSHKWDYGEPDFRMMENISVYDLPPSLTHDKLRMFCSRARDAKLRWAWSDTCCINKDNSAVLQESFVSMFKWYRGSALTIVYLRGVEPQSRGLVDSLWNTRAWTYQEYVAAKVIQFYSEDWTPYLNLPVVDHDLENHIFNHKTSPKIIREMSQVIRKQVGDIEWPELQPDLNHVREKLCLASTRQATFVEDTAYSLFGILATYIPVMYGEGEEALGRFLAEVLMSSRDVSILAWTGKSGTYNSCLPARIIVFKDLATSYLPQPLGSAEPETIVKRLRSLRPKLHKDAMKLYDRLRGLPRPWFTGKCMHLPCITFPLKKVSRGHDHEPSVYQAMALGKVEITTEQDLSEMTLVLVHPWVNSLFDHDDDDEAPSRYKETRALRLAARIRRPFGALLLAQTSNKVYTRVAADSKITAQVQENVDLVQLSNDVHTLEVL